MLIMLRYKGYRALAFRRREEPFFQLKTEVSSRFCKKLIPWPAHSRLKRHDLMATGVKRREARYKRKKWYRVRLVTRSGKT